MMIPCQYLADMSCNNQIYTFGCWAICQLPAFRVLRAVTLFVSFASRLSFKKEGSCALTDSTCPKCQGTEIIEVK